MSDTHALNNVNCLTYELKADFYVTRSQVFGTNMGFRTFFSPSSIGLFVWEAAVSVLLFSFYPEQRSPKFPTSSSFGISVTLTLETVVMWPLQFLCCIGVLIRHKITLSHFCEIKVSGSYLEIGDVGICESHSTGGWRGWANRPLPLVGIWIHQNLDFSSTSWGKALIFSFPW